MEAKKTFFKIALVLIAGLFLVAFLTQPDTSHPVDQVEDETAEELESVQTAVSTPKTTVKQFSAQEFKLAYDNLSLPNIVPIVSPPEITGDTAADKQIQKLAEQRGYQLRHVASGLLNEVEDLPVQELLIKSWQDLRQQATEDGYTVKIRSGYRSIEDQRELFVSRLYAAGASENAIGQGLQDSIVNAVLATTAPPGYSRHHSGYTIDLEDPGSSVFGNSAAYGWISANNFEKAKLYGFIPSYPDGLINQGPNPEPWEFVWVSDSVTYE